MDILLQVIALYLLVVTLDVLVGWIQPDPARMPRRALHAATEPLQAPLRALIPAARTGGLDLSPLIIIGALGLVRLSLLALS